MTSSLVKSVLAGSVAILFVTFAGSARADDAVAQQVAAAIGKRDITTIEGLLSRGPGNVDSVMRTMLERAQQTIKTDPQFTAQMMGVAADYAPQITPSMVPVVCADVRRLVKDVMTPEDAGSALYSAVMKVSESFSKAPVVVAAGRPNECETAFNEIGNFNGETLLFQNPGMRAPGRPPVTIHPGLPPSAPSKDDKPSAD